MPLKPLCAERVRISNRRRPRRDYLSHCHNFVTELCVLRTFGGVDFSLVFICAQSVPELLWNILRASIQFPVMPKRAQYARFSGECVAAPAPAADMQNVPRRNAFSFKSHIHREHTTWALTITPHPRRVEMHGTRVTSDPCFKNVAARRGGGAEDLRDERPHSDDDPQ
eukprot:COSAG02_NODE_280_length_25797_cov_66.644447_8_plen_168_part_00